MSGARRGAQVTARLERGARRRAVPGRSDLVRLDLGGITGRRRQGVRRGNDAGRTAWACLEQRWAGTNEAASAGAVGADGSKQGRERSPVRRA
ncbi:hypothetical protein [Streptosporangium sp. CA-115845]|uniref:hypothetical protein n=1 Tax=Streptosporangium sp. CA-115845 TaxID=3240071 RepID=UPI003D936A36